MTVIYQRPPESVESAPTWLAVVAFFTGTYGALFAWIGVELLREWCST